MIVMHVCDFYVTVLFYLYSLDDCISVDICLLFSYFSRKWLANPSNKHFSVFLPYPNEALLKIMYLHIFQKK